MTWFKVDDTLAFHHKVVAAGNAAMGLWVRAGSLSAQQTSDGHVDAEMICKLGGRKRDAEKLIAVKLWHPDEGGYIFHEWEQANPTRAEILAARSAAAARQARHRARSSPNSATSAPNSAISAPYGDQTNGRVRW